MLTRRTATASRVATDVCLDSHVDLSTAPSAASSAAADPSDVPLPIIKP